MVNLITYADTIGLSDEALSSVILTYLKRHKNELFYSISPKKGNLKIMIDTLSLQCSTSAEVTQIKHELSRFQREQHEPFSTAVARFDSLYSHLSELKAPISNNALSRLSLQTLKLITPYLISNGAAKIYGDWLQSELSLDREVNRDRIIQCVLKLENNDKFKLDRNRGTHTI